MRSPLTLIAFLLTIQAVSAAVHADKKEVGTLDARALRIKAHNEELSEMYSPKKSPMGGGVSTPGANVTWTTKLLATTYQPGHHPWSFAPGYSALVGRLYVTTDVDNTLYAIDSATGNLEWIRADLPKSVPKSLAFQRQITGNEDTVILYFGNIIYYFNSTNGRTIYAIPLSSTEAVVYVYNYRLLVTYDNVIETRCLKTGLVLWKINDASNINTIMTQTRYTTNKDGSKDLIAFSQGVSTDGDGNTLFHQVIYNSTSGARLMKSKKQFSTGDVNPYIIVVDARGLYTIDFETNMLSLINMTGDVVYSTYYGSAGVTGYGVAPEALVFFKLGKYSMASYNRDTGNLVTSLPNLQSQGISGCSHIEGYQNFGLLICETDEGLVNISAWNSTNMQTPPLWSYLTSHTDAEHLAFGNWLGVVTVLSTNGLEVINGNDGAIIYDGFSKYPNVNFQSLVTTNARQTFFFTHSDYAVGMSFTP